MRKLVFLLVMLSLTIGAAQVAAQEATPTVEPTVTPTPLPPMQFTATLTPFSGDSNNFAGVDPSGVTITYWHQYTSAFQLSVVSGIIDAFNSSNPYGITVQQVAQGNYGDIHNLMNNAIVSGNLPNLVAGYPNDALSYAQDDVVVDLAPYYSDAKWGFTADQSADLNQTALDAWVSDSMRIGIPNQLSGEVTFSNAAMMQQLGFSADSPSTLDEFSAAACAAAQSSLTGAAGGKVQGFPIVADASQYEYLVAGIGGSIWKDGKWDFTNAEATRVLQMFHDLYAQGCAYIPTARFGNTADWAGALNPFALSSSAGIQPTLATVHTDGDLVTDWRVLPAPTNAQGDKPIVELFTPGIMVIQGTPEQNLASWLFLRFFSQPEVQAQWAQALSLFPLSNSAAGMMDASQMNPQFADMVSKVASGAVGTYVSQQNLSYGDVRNLVATAITDVTSGGKDVAAVAQQLTDDANKALANP
jgi:multiple sugar transport system substrate-binding protein